MINISSTPTQRSAWESANRQDLPHRPAAGTTQFPSRINLKRLSIRAIYVTGIDSPDPQLATPSTSRSTGAAPLGGKSGTRKIKSAKKEEIELRPNALTTRQLSRRKPQGR